MVGWGTPGARPLEEVSVAELRGRAADGQFGAGGMGPKVEAVCRYVERTGRRAAITSLRRISEAAAGRRPGRACTRRRGVSAARTRCARSRHRSSSAARSAAGSRRSGSTSRPWAASTPARDRRPAGRDDGEHLAVRPGEARPAGPGVERGELPRRVEVPLLRERRPPREGVRHGQGPLGRNASTSRWCAGPKRRSCSHHWCRSAGQRRPGDGHPGPRLDGPPPAAPRRCGRRTVLVGEEARGRVVGVPAGVDQDPDAARTPRDAAAVLLAVGPQRARAGPCSRSSRCRSSSSAPTRGRPRRRGTSVPSRRHASRPPARRRPR